MVWVVKIGQLVLMKIAFYAKNKQKIAILNMTSYLLTSKYFNKTDSNVKGTNSPLENGIIYILKRETRNTENQKC